MTTFNSISAAATAAIYCVFQRVSEENLQTVENQISEQFNTNATPVFYVDGQKGAEVSVNFKGYTFIVTENFNTGEYTVAIKNI